MSIFVFCKLIGSLVLLIYGMKTVSKALTKTDRWAFAPYFGCYDHESLHRIVDRCIVQPSTATNSIFGRRRISFG